MQMRVINLNRSQDRLAGFRARNPARDDIVRFPAIDGSQADRGRLIATEVLSPDLEYTDGALGCALSHLMQWRDVIQSDAMLTIVEDDTILAANFVEEASRLLDLLPSDWEYVMWGYNFDAAVTFDLLPGYTPCQAVFDQDASRRSSQNFSCETVDSRLFRLFGAFGTACYSISPRGARRLLDFCLPLRPMMVQHPSLPGPLPNTGIDSMIAKLWPSMQAFVAVPPLAITDNEHAISTVQVPRESEATILVEMLSNETTALALMPKMQKEIVRHPIPSRIPQILHYVFGMAADFGGKPWSLVHHACLLSAIEKIKPEKIFFHYAYEPSGPWWELSRPLVTLKRIETPTEIYGNPLLHVAHRAGVTRLRVLLEHGGIYLDADVLVHRSFDDLMNYSAVMGIEGKDQVQGLADAVILAEPGAPFIRTWLESYKSFRSKGRDEYWAEHAVWMPARISQEQPDDIYILPHTAFFWPLWTPDHLTWIYDSTLPVDTNPYANHLWEAVAWDQFKDLTPGQVRRKASNFHSWLRPYVANLSDDYGTSLTFGEQAFSQAQLSHRDENQASKSSRLQDGKIKIELPVFHHS